MKNWIKKYSIGISLVPVIAVMVMIYCFSAQTGSESGAMSGRITGWFLNLLVPDYQNMLPLEQENLRNLAGLIVRKLGHFSEYALLGVTLMMHISQLRKKIKMCLPWLWAWGVGTLYAATDEFHQGFVAGRGPSVVDVGIDSLGVIAGIGVMLAILCLYHRKKRRNRQCCKSPESLL